MAQLSISAAWSEASAFVKREAGLLFPVAFLLVALPSAVLQFVMPAGGPDEAPRLGAWLLLLPVVVVVGMIGSIALSYLALRPGASVGEALGVGARRFVMLLGASLLLMLGMIVALFPLVLLATGGAALGGGDPAAMAGPLLAVMLVALIAAVALWTRLMLMTPVAAVEPVGPIGIIARSWRLTAGHFWKLLGFVLLLILVFLVVSLVVGAIGGIVIVLVAGAPLPGSPAALLVLLLGAAVNMVLTVYVAALVARLYLQLAGDAPEKVFS